MATRRVVQTRTTREEQRKAQRIARQRGVSVAEALRQLVDEEADRIGEGSTVRGDLPSGTRRGE
jgi:hypothetical protein